MFKGQISAPATLHTDVSMSKEQLAEALKAAALSMGGYGAEFDDAGEFWYTYDSGKKVYTFVGADYRPVFNKAATAHLIDSMNILIFGKVLNLDPEDAEQRLEEYREEI